MNYSLLPLLPCLLVVGVCHGHPEDTPDYAPHLVRTLVEFIELPAAAMNRLMFGPDAPRNDPDLRQAVGVIYSQPRRVLPGRRP